MIRMPCKSVHVLISTVSTEVVSFKFKSSKWQYPIMTDTIVDILLLYNQRGDLHPFNANREKMFVYILHEA